MLRVSTSPIHRCIPLCIEAIVQGALIRRPFRTELGLKHPPELVQPEQSHRPKLFRRGDASLATVHGFAPTVERA